MTTVSDLVTDAMSKCGAAGQDQTVSAADAAVCLRDLQRIVDSWANDPLTVYTTAEATVSTVAGTASYATSLWTPTTRPVTIQNIWLASSGVDYPIGVLTEPEYDAIPTKTSRGVPEAFFYKPGATTGTLYLYPTPDKVYVGHINGRFPLATGLALSTTISLPPGYERALCDALALEIAPSFGVKDVSLLMTKARNSRNALKATNYVPMKLATGLPGSGYDAPSYIRIIGDT